MGSSAKTGEKFFRGSPEHFCDKNAIWDRTPPPPTHQLQSTCVGEGSRVPNLQTEFNYLDSFKSYGIFSDFVVPVVPMLSPSSPHRPCCPHVVPVSSPRRPHSPQKVPMWSPWLWSPWLWSPWLWSPLSPWSPPHVVPVVPTSSPCHPRHPHSPQKVPMWSPWLWSPWSPLSPWSPPHVVPVVPTSSPSSPHHLEGPHIIPNPPDTHSTHLLPPWGVGGPESVKMQ